MNTMWKKCIVSWSTHRCVEVILDKASKVYRSSWKLMTAWNLESCSWWLFTCQWHHIESDISKTIGEVVWKQYSIQSLIMENSHVFKIQQLISVLEMKKHHIRGSNMVLRTTTKSGWCLIPISKTVEEIFS